jgi:hypothetical protein
MTVAAPLLFRGLVLDSLVRPFIRGRGNAYRVLARKEAG